MEVKKLAMLGCGSMGGGMALLFAENGLEVLLHDPNNDNMEKILQKAKEDDLQDRISKYSNYKELCQNLGEPKVFVMSLPHGSVGDTVVEGLMPYLTKGDTIIDCGNEHWRNTERRQGKCITKGIRYVGCGVSGGYQAARRGPSMCPGADDETLDLVLPLLRKVAAKDTNDKPCVGKVGTGGAGHYCKMIHNGIEHGMMSAISEAWAIMTKGLEMSLSEVADELERWNTEGELRGTFLIKIGVDICRTKDPKTGQRILETVEDKVVQDFTGEEGTGVWSNDEAIERHIPAPTLSTAHFLRIASGDHNLRSEIQETFGGVIASHQKIEPHDRAALLENLRLAVYTACLAAYVQGMNIISKADKTFHFNVNYPELFQVWRAGCIIQADYISDSLLQPIYSNASHNPQQNLLCDGKIAKELLRGYGAVKNVVVEAVKNDHVIPTLSATLDYLKIMTSTELPTSFYEAELDYFGAHMFDVKGEKSRDETTGRHHFEWKPA